MTNDTGNREWLDEYMSLKQVKSDNPFTVPAGYFEELEQRITSYVKLDSIKDKAFNGFTVPENYFNDLTANIQSRINIENSLSADMETAGFNVPDNYFNDLQGRITANVMVEEALVNAGNSFTVPDGYFDKLSKNIINKTVNQEMVNQKMSDRKGIVRKLFSSSAVKHATAACFTLVVGAAFLLKGDYSSPEVVHDHSYLHKALSNVSVNDIQNYLELDLDASDTHTLLDNGKNINSAALDKDLRDYLDTDQ